MNKLPFIRSVIVALVLSLAAVILYLSFSLLVSDGFAIRLTTAGVTLAYITFLLSHTDVAFGKVTTVTAFVVLCAALFYGYPSILMFALFQVGMIWLVRAVYFHSSILLALADLLFTLVSFTAAIGAITQSNSVFMSFWSFFLGQAMVLPILAYVCGKGKCDKDRLLPNTVLFTDASAQKFQRAQRNAESALRKLAESN